jgi:hypothetical protein
MTVDQFFFQYPSAIGVWQVGAKLYLRTAEAKAKEEARKQGVEAVWVTPQPAASATPTCP